MICALEFQVSYSTIFRKNANAENILDIIWK